MLLFKLAKYFNTSPSYFLTFPAVERLVYYITNNYIALSKITQV
ncbi:hypothetical protein P7H15_10915 [Paenibacillus larvae]|nr:hypothetical protein [Paenibacillus larvae]